MKGGDHHRRRHRRAAAAHQLERLARRAGSKDVADVRMLANGRMNALYTATVEAAEEAIVNALVAAETMTGINGRRVEALPHDRMRAVMQKYNRAPARR